MSYQEFIDFIYNMTLSNIHMKLDNMKVMQKALDNPEKKFNAIHIAGTNGKGSVSLKIATALKLSGYKTALYTSPHISTFRERIIINDELISEEDILDIGKMILSTAKNLNVQLSFFELLTLIAFDYFAKNKVDFAVIETGLGGRLDATNSILPLISVIVSIGYDHMYVLGSSLDEIAMEKAGIIKPNIPLVIGPKADFEPIRRRASELNSKVILAQEINGFYDHQNSMVALAALKEMKKKYHLIDEAIENGIKVRPKCRFELINDKQNAIILDVGHNEDAFKALFLAVDEFYPNKNIRMVIGLSKDKDIKSCLKIALFRASFIHLVAASNLRASLTQDMSLILQNEGYCAFSEESSVRAGINNAKQAQKENEILVICGTFFIMSEARIALGIEEESDVCDMNEKHAISNQKN